MSGLCPRLSVDWRLDCPGFVLSLWFRVEVMASETRPGNSETTNFAANSSILENWKTGKLENRFSGILVTRWKIRI